MDGECERPSSVAFREVRELQTVVLIATVALCALLLALTVGVVVVQNRAQRRHRATVERFRGLLEGAHEAFVSIDAEGLITSWNAEAETTFGWPREEAIGRELAETIIPERFREMHRQGLERFRATGEGRVINRLLELSALHREGREFPVELTISPQRVDGEWHFNAFIRDVSERREQEQAVRDLAAIVESSDDAILAKTLEGEITSWNRGAERIYGYGAAEEVIGQPMSILDPPDAVDEIDGLLEGVRRGETVDHYETERVRKDGRRIHVSLTIRRSATRTGRSWARA